MSAGYRGSRLKGQERDFKVGNRVISNGHHAEVVSVPFNLCAKVPAAISDEAAFTVLADIA